jgi:hypothetical protein
MNGTDGLGRSSWASRLIGEFGGRWSTELDLDIDHVGEDVDRWFLASTLFGTRISAAIAVRTYRVLRAHGVSTLIEVAPSRWGDLVAWLDEGGYTRYDFRTASRLLELAEVVAQHYGAPHEIGPRLPDPRHLEAALDALPGWGPSTVGIFLRELRGVWPGAQPPLDARVIAAGRHLGLLRAPRSTPRQLAAVAATQQVDARDLEAALARCAIRHHHRYDRCPGGARCVIAGAGSLASNAVPLHPTDQENRSTHDCLNRQHEAVHHESR